MRKIFCDCCKREIGDVEPLFSMEITKGYQNKDIYVQDMCVDCYGRIKDIVDNAEHRRKIQRGEMA